MNTLPKLSEVDPALLINISACIIHALNGTIPPSARVMPEPPDKETTRARQERNRRTQGAKPRVYKSRFVGVTVHRGRWVGFVDTLSTKHGPKRELTDEGELQAALDRAHALGLAEPEMRPAAQVAQREEHDAPRVSSHGPFKKALGGKRIA